MMKGLAEKFLQAKNKYEKKNGVKLLNARVETSMDSESLRYILAVWYQREDDRRNQTYTSIYLDSKLEVRSLSRVLKRMIKNGEL